MTKRTKKDVRKLGQAGFEPDYGMYGRITGVDDWRMQRFVDHGWIVDMGGELTQTGKQICFHYKRLQQPKQELDERSVSSFISKAQEQINPTLDEVPRDYYKQIPVKDDDPDNPNIPSGHRHYEEVDHRDGKTDVELVGRNIARGNHIKLKGDTGTGKTKMAKHLAQMTMTETESVNFSKEVRIQHLLGHYEVYEKNGASEMVWIDGVLTSMARAHQPDCSRDEPTEGTCPECGEKGGWFIADELNSADGATTMMLHSVTEKDDPSLTIPESGETVPIHPDFRLIGTLNPDYAGTRKQNEAFGSRFYHLKKDYLPKGQEADVVLQQAEIVQSDPEDLRDDIERVLELVNDLRAEFRAGEIDTPITPREVMRIAENLDGGWMGFEEAVKDVILGRVKSHEDSAVEKTIESTL